MRTAGEKLEAGSRVDKLRKKMLTMPEICIERGRLMTQSYRETEPEPAVVRRAKALRKILAEMSIGIDDGELIVGRGSSKQRGGILTPELTSKWYLEEMDLLSARGIDRFAPIGDADKLEMMEFLPYWQGKSLIDRWRAGIPEDILKLNNLVQGGGAYCGNNQYYGHSSADYDRVLHKGLNGLKEEARAAMMKINMADPRQFQKYHFLQAVEITLEAAAAFAARYAALAAKMAAGQTDRDSRAELEKIAGICSRVPAGPASSFHEALQSVWFAYLVLMIEGPGPGNGFGRVDQYLYPFYKKDLEEGKITRDEARELIELLYIKTNGLVIPYPTETATFYAGFTLGANITLGGLTQDGRDAVNELSYLFLEAEREVALNSEDIIVRIHKKTPQAFVVKACETAIALGGKIKFLSDETTMLQLLKDGKPVEYARNYIITGCNSPSVPGRSLDLPGGMVNLPLLLELALHNGVCRLTGKLIGPQSGDPRKFGSYEEVWQAYRRQVEALMPVGLLFRNVDKQLFAEYAPMPFQSSLFYDCIEKGLDITAGGTAPYLSFAVSLAGIPNVADSLAAIKKAVFEDKKISMARLIDALDKNFDGEEEILHILAGAPKFGNDMAYVDSIADEVIGLGSGEAGKVKGFAGAVSNCAAGTVTANIPLGAVVGALPDGRKAGQPLAEGGISPHQGRNTSGPAATLMSVARLDHAKITNGSVLNMRFSPDALQDAGKIKKFAAMIRTFCETGGGLVQFNIVSTATLREAQKEPEKYKDLLVRVATYSAYFVELSSELQNDIIQRMEFQQV